MQPLQQHLPTPSTLTPVSSTDAGTSAEPGQNGAAVPLHWVADLFGRLGAILGARLADLYAGADPDEVQRQWAEGLVGFSGDEIRRGIAATRLGKFPPNLPQFLHLCRPALDAELAWHEAVQGMAAHGREEIFAWSHPAVYWAGRQVQSELRSGTFAQHRRRWEALMQAEWAKGAWASPPDPRQRVLPAQQAAAGSRWSKAEALQRMQRTRDQIAARRAGRES